MFCFLSFLQVTTFIGDNVAIKCCSVLSFVKSNEDYGVLAKHIVS